MNRKSVVLLGCILVFCAGVTAQAKELLTGIVLAGESQALAIGRLYSKLLLFQAAGLNG